MKMKVELFLT